MHHSQRLPHSKGRGLERDHLSSLHKAKQHIFSLLVRNHQHVCETLEPAQTGYG